MLWRQEEVMVQDAEDEDAEVRLLQEEEQLLRRWWWLRWRMLWQCSGILLCS